MLQRFLSEVNTVGGVRRPTLAKPIIESEADILGENPEWVIAKQPKKVVALGKGLSCVIYMVMRYFDFK
jgi:hypothetical protein